jgi:hypothetical protein
MALINGDKLGSEAQSDDGDVQFAVTHRRQNLQWQRARQALFASVFNGVKRINASSTKQCQRQNGRKIGENGMGEWGASQVSSFPSLACCKPVPGANRKLNKKETKETNSKACFCHKTLASLPKPLSILLSAGRLHDSGTA